MSRGFSSAETPARRSAKAAVKLVRSIVLDVLQGYYGMGRVLGKFVDRVAVSVYCTFTYVVIAGQNVDPG